MDDIAIVEQVLSGDSDRFGLLVDKYQNRIFRVCMGFVHHQHDAEDLTQEVFINAYRSLSSYKGNALFSTWLHSIAVNQALTFVRSNKRTKVVSLVETMSDAYVSQGHVGSKNPQQLLEHQQMGDAITTIMNRLPENQRIAFTLKKYDGMSQAEIAQIMELNEGAIESLIQRAKKNLQKFLADYKII